ncbi:hypothetical protein TYRP_007809 [Tyrophagus putrescentiae]|nr:hypothetical protein TYRP_007809 [Tyrophagus putrescentiae]
MPPESSSSSDDQQQQLLLTTTTTTTEGEAEPQLSKRGQLVAADLAALRQLLTAHSTAFARQLEADLEHLEQSVIDPLVERTEQRTTALLASAHRSLAETAERWRAGGRQLKSSLEEGAEAVGDSLQQAAQAVATLCSGTLAPALKKLATEAAAVAGEAATVVTEIGGSLESAASSSASESASVEFSFSSSGGPGAAAAVHRGRSLRGEPERPTEASGRLAGHQVWPHRAEHQVRQRRLARRVAPLQWAFRRSSSSSLS